MTIFSFDMENKISVCVRNWKFKTWVLKPRFENPDSESEFQIYFKKSNFLHKKIPNAALVVCNHIGVSVQDLVAALAVDQ